MFWQLSANRFAGSVSINKAEMSSTLQPQKKTEMFYVKNVLKWEHALRTIMAVMAAAFAEGSPGLAMGTGIMGILGALLAMTGLFGFCPMWAHGRPQARQKALNP